MASKTLTGNSSGAGHVSLLQDTFPVNVPLLEGSRPMCKQPGQPLPVCGKSGGLSPGSHFRGESEAKPELLCPGAGTDSDGHSGGRGRCKELSTNAG